MSFFVDAEKCGPPTNDEERKNITYTNLLLLGFDIGIVENDFRTKFSQDMFDKVNKTASEVVLYFLFSKLNSELAKLEFKTCYPVFDKKQEQCFRRICGNWILILAKDNPEFNFPPAVSSILMKKGGRKFYHLLFSLSRYVLYEVARETAAYDPMLHLMPPTQIIKKLIPLEASRKIFQSLLDHHTNSFVANQQFVIWHVKEERIGNLISQYYNLKKQIKQTSTDLELFLDDLELSRTAQSKILRRDYCSEWDQLVSNSKKKEDEVNMLWTDIEMLLTMKKKMWDFWKSAMGRKSVDMVLDGNSIVQELPEALRNEQLPSELRLSTICSNWNDTLTHLVKQVREVNFPIITPVAEDSLQFHKHQLENVKKFRDNLNEALPNIQEDCMAQWNKYRGLSDPEKLREQLRRFHSGSASSTFQASPPVNLYPIKREKFSSFTTASSPVLGRNRRMMDSISTLESLRSQDVSSSLRSQEGSSSLRSQDVVSRRDQPLVSRGYQDGQCALNLAKYRTMSTTSKQVGKQVKDFSQNFGTARKRTTNSVVLESTVMFKYHHQVSVSSINLNKVKIDDKSWTGRRKVSVTTPSNMQQFSSRKSEDKHNDESELTDFMSMEYENATTPFNVDRQFTLGVLDSPLCRLSFLEHEPITLPALTTPSPPLPPRLLKLLKSRKIADEEEEPFLELDNRLSPEGKNSSGSDVMGYDEDETNSLGKELSCTLIFGDEKMNDIDGSDKTCSLVSSEVMDAMVPEVMVPTARMQSDVGGDGLVFDNSKEESLMSEKLIDLDSIVSGNILEKNDLLENLSSRVKVQGNKLGYQISGDGWMHSWSIEQPGSIATERPRDVEWKDLVPRFSPTVAEFLNWDETVLTSHDDLPLSSEEGLHRLASNPNFLIPEGGSSESQLERDDVTLHSSSSLPEVRIFADSTFVAPKVVIPLPEKRQSLTPMEVIRNMKRVLANPIQVSSSASSSDTVKTTGTSVSQSNLSLVDIFREDDTCLVPSSPTT